MDKVNSILSFVEVARCGSFTQAAEHLGLSRLQVTRHVQDIEKWLNLRMFHRTTRSVSLTTQGEEALIYCQRILDEVASLESRAHSHNSELIGTIRVATPIGLGQNMLFDVVEQFVTLHPKVSIQLVLSDSISGLVDDRVDVALRYTHQPDENFIARKLMRIETVICASPEYLVKAPVLKVPNDLLQHNCLVHSSISSWHILSVNSEEKVRVKGNIQANDMGVLAKAALRGLGIIRLPCDLANPLLKEGQLVEVLSEYHSLGQNLWVVYLSRNYQQNVVRAFIDFIAEQWADDIKNY